MHVFSTRGNWKSLSEAVHWNPLEWELVASRYFPKGL